jgi:sirohydrochlorin cobaltochelatase
MAGVSAMKGNGMRGVLLFAHGSRDPLWRKPIEAVADTIRQRQPGTLVRCAYLELCEPSLPEAAAELVAQGATELRILPMFLGMGKHAREDLPELVEALRLSHPNVAVAVLPAVGEQPRLTALMAEMALEPMP